jgi:two-component system cell cycle response regulator
MKILLMEDDKILQKMYQDKFSSTDYDLIVASDGEEGLEKAKSDKPDFILLDLMMPKLSGIQVLKELKGDTELSHIPVAILSVIPRDDSMLEGNEALLADIVAYYRKDENNPSDIIEKVKDYLGSGKA